MATQKLKPRLFSLIPRAMKIEAVSGDETLIRSDEFHYMRPSFRNNHRMGPVEKTDEVRVLGIELLAPATFREMFEPLAGDVTTLAFTENQIVNFVRRERAWMGRNGTTYFLFRYNKGIVVAVIFAIPSMTSYGVDVHALDDPTVWNHPSFKNCVVVPRINR